MNKNAQTIRERLIAAKAEFDSATAAVKNLEKSCTHSWSATVSTPIEEGGYSVRNMMGPIRNGQPVLPDVYVPVTYKPCWTRTCAHCGRVETTTDVNTHTVSTPKW